MGLFSSLKCIQTLGPFRNRSFWMWDRCMVSQGTNGEKTCEAYIHTLLSADLSYYLRCIEAQMKERVMIHLLYLVYQDRVLYRSKDPSSIQPVLYSSCVSVKTSDHR